MQLKKAQIWFGNKTSKFFLEALPLYCNTFHHSALRNSKKGKGRFPKYQNKIHEHLPHLQTTMIRTLFLIANPHSSIHF